LSWYCKSPHLHTQKCPHCGEEVEIFSNDGKGTCGNCGFIIYNDNLSSIPWCRYAKECAGEETYRKLVEGKEG
jgi:ribosomal protein S27AE